MELSAKLDQLFTDSFSELFELSSFRQSTLVGYDLIEEKYKEHLKYIEKHIPLFDKAKNLSRLDSIRKEVKLREVHNLRGKQNIYVNTINKSIIIYACSIFDFFLNEAMKYLFQYHPKNLASEKKTIPYHEFILNSKETIIEKIIEKEIYEISYGSIDQRIKYFSDNFDLDLMYTDDETYFFSNKVNLTKINEVYAIRNIIVHNKGIVNKIYLDTVPESGYSLNEIIKIDDNLINSIITILLKTESCIGRQMEMRYY